MSERLGKKPFYSRRGLCARLGWEWAELRLLAGHAETHYKPFRRKQKNGKSRLIDAPQGDLKKVQRDIANLIQTEVTFPSTMLGGIKGGSPKKNALIHLGESVVFKLDIRNCFPSITNHHVFRVFRERFKFSDELSRLLTRLTTYKGKLPQGSPASSVLANLVLWPLHDDVLGVCAPMGVKCTFYVDDITLSGERVRDVAGKVIGLITKYGLSVSAKKLGVFVRHREKQLVTGIVVNRWRPSVGRARLEELRARINRLAAAKHWSSTDMKSLQSSIAQIGGVSKSQGLYLSRYAKKKIPAYCAPRRRYPVSRVESDALGVVSSCSLLPREARR